MSNTPEQQAALDTIQAQFDALAAANTYTGELTTDLAEMQTRAENAERTLDGANDTIGQQSAEIEVLQTNLNALQAEYDAYRLSHPDDEPPPPPPPVFRFGITVGANDVRHPGGGQDDLQWSVANARTVLGTQDLGELLKCFGDHGIADAMAMWGAIDPLPVNPLLADALFSQAALDGVMDELTVPIDYCYLQEFQRKLSTVADYDDFNAKYELLRTQIDNHPNGHLVHLRYVGSEAQERSRIASGLPPLYERVQVQPRCGVGNDTYVTQNQYLTVAAATKGSVDFYNSVKDEVEGINLQLSEVGISKINFTAQQRATWVTQLSAYIESVDPGGSIDYWFTNNRTSGSPANDWSGVLPADQVFVDALRSLIRH